MKGIRTIVACVVLLAYVGQAMASATMSCIMMSGPGSSLDAPQSNAGVPAALAHHNMDHATMSAAGIDHSAHGEISTKGDSGCCDTGAFCDMSHCQAAAALLHNSAYALASAGHFYLGSAGPINLEHDSSSPFRPPISL